MRGRTSNGMRLIQTFERVPPLADVRQCGRNIPVELGDIVRGEAVKEAGVLLLITQDLARESAKYDGE